MNIPFSTMKDEEKQDQLDNDVSFVTLMIIVHNMLKLDYIMQVNLHPASVCLVASMLQFAEPEKKQIMQFLCNILVLTKRTPAGKDCQCTIP